MSISNKFDLTDKVAIITGSSKGIGEAMARGMAELGAKVILSSRKQDAVDAVAEQFKSDGLEATGIACHVGEEEQLQHLVAKTAEAYGGVDILVNNAAINPVWTPIAQVGGDVFDKMVQVNVKSCFTLSNLCYPHMVKRGGGSVIHISSVEGLKPSFGLGVYSMTKAAVIMLAQNQAKEWGPDSIRVNAICPGLVKTKLSAGLWQNESILDKYEQSIPLGRMAMPDEMVGLALFLASDASSYTTGGIFTADGGYMLAG